MATSKVETKIINGVEYEICDCCGKPKKGTGKSLPGYAFFVVKNFVRKKQIVDFVGQWEQLCTACGFETLYEIRAWQVDEHGTQQGMEGKHKKLSKSKKSFFRRLHESKYPNTAIDYEVVLVMRKMELPTLFDPRPYHGALPEWGTPTNVAVVSPIDSILRPVV